MIEEKIRAYIDINLTIGQKILIRSAHEVTYKKDFALSIVFSASAFEIDLRSYHYKWKMLKSIENGYDISEEDPNEIFRKYYSIIHKIKKTVRLAYLDGLEHYCEIEGNISDTLENFPSLNPETLAADIQRNLFNPRNKILHLGETDYTEEDAIKAYNISRFSIKILESIDNYSG